MKKVLAVFFSFTLLATCSIALAENGKDNSINKEQKEQNRANHLTAVADLKQKRENWKTERQENLEKLKQEKETLKNTFKEKFTAERCSSINARVQERIANFDNVSVKHTQVYTNLVNRINKFIARFDAQTLDTTAIKAHMTVLQTKIDKFKADYAAYILKFKETKTLTCGHSEGEFKGTLLEAKALLKTVHDDAADIRVYVRTVILSDLKALKALMPKEEGTDDANNNPVPTNTTTNQ